MQKINSLPLLTVSILVSLLIPNIRAAKCTWDGTKVVLPYGANKNLEILDNSVIDKDKANWFDLKKCFFAINEVDRTNLDGNKVAVLNKAFATVKKTLNRYRAESITMIAAVLYASFCKEELDLSKASELKTIKDSDIKNLEDIPHIFKNSFSANVQLLKCTNGKNSKILLVSVLGSIGDTSDYDFNIFIIDKAAVQNIQKELFKYAQKNNVLNDQTNKFKQVGNDQVILTEDNLILLEDKNIFMSFASMMITNFIESSEVVKDLYLKFQQKIPSIKLLKDPTEFEQSAANALNAQNLLLANYTPVVGDAHGINLSCGALNTCYDSNAYPDTMAINRLVFKLPMSLLDQQPGKAKTAFNQNDLDHLNYGYLHLSLNSICEFSELPAKKAHSNELKAHLIAQQEECSLKLRGHVVGNDKHIGLVVMDKEIAYYDNNGNAESTKTFPDCMERNIGTIWDKNAKKVKNDMNFLDIFYLSNVIAVCTIYLDEGYFTFGALEHFKFGGNKAITIQNFSLAESLKENMSMMLIHFEEKMHDGEKVGSQSYSDQMSKYQLRAVTAHEVLALNLIVHKERGIHLFDADNIKAFVHNNAAIKTLVKQDPVFKNFIKTSPVIKKKETYLDPNFTTEDYFEELDVKKFKTLNAFSNGDDELTVYYGCIESLFLFTDSLTITKKIPKDEVFNFDATDLKYQDDNQKKAVYFHKYTRFIKNQTLPVCPEFTTPQQLFSFILLSVRTINNYMYFLINKHIKTYQQRVKAVKYMAVDDSDVNLVLVKANIESIKEITQADVNINVNDFTQGADKGLFLDKLELQEHQHGGHKDHDHNKAHGNLQEITNLVNTSILQNASEILVDFKEKDYESQGLENLWNLLPKASNDLANGTGVDIKKTKEELEKTLKFKDVSAEENRRLII